MTVQCTKCGYQVRRPCTAANDYNPNDQKFVIMACDEVLSNLVYYRRLATAMASLMLNRPLSRRKFADYMATTIFGFLGNDGIVCDRNVKPIVIRDTAIDDAFKDDGSFRWLSDFVKRGVDPKQRPPASTLVRLRIIDLTFRIAMPEIAKHFSR